MTGSPDAPGDGRRFTLPLAHLPPGFDRTLDDPPRPPVAPRPAATVALLRERSGGLEVLLMQRVRSSGFIPGAWVFPGGMVDPHDPPGRASEIAALREVFEETGLLLARRAGEAVVRACSEEPELRAARAALLSGQSTFTSVLATLGLEADPDRLTLFARWITPVIEPRRYDACFFAAAVPGDLPISVHEAELSQARWQSPAEALEAHDAGALPMVFPTVHTLERLAAFRRVDEALSALRTSTIPAWLPRLERTGDSVRMHLAELDQPDQGVNPDSSRSTRSPASG